LTAFIICTKCKAKIHRVISLDPLGKIGYCYIFKQDPNGNNYSAVLSCCGGAYLVKSTDKDRLIGYLKELVPQLEFLEEDDFQDRFKKITTLDGVDSGVLKI
jgi:hypothetical protein